MGSPVSPVVANLCMEAIEEMAINTSEVQPKVWKRYVDDSFCIIKRDAVNSFHTTLNSIDPHISFTIEEESDQQIAFLDTLVSRKDNTITIDVYRKATHTDRYLDFSSHHDKRHKISTAETLLHRAIKLPSTPQGKNTEINHVFDALRANNYPSFVISNILKQKFSKPTTHAIPSPEELHMQITIKHYRDDNESMKAMTLAEVSFLIYLPGVAWFATRFDLTAIHDLGCC
ncbi:uncharacterized protein [Montipora capricornis]|uniref:uncharacterized protein n=1 Tax=Montipora capricornis TaxID=246305 RepID=UPI0035F1399A